MTDRSDTHADRPAILTRALILVLASGFGALTSFYVLLSVVPLYATTGGAGGTGAGLTTGTLMFATVAAELATPRLLARFGYRPVFATGLVLLGVPAVALTASDGMAAILAVCAVRGLGFAVVVVVGGALVASLVPPERRGEGLGIYGIVTHPAGEGSRAPGASRRSRRQTSRAMTSVSAPNERSNRPWRWRR
ncbi:MAG: MFS transporter [Acidimicrobiales bacterium]